MLGAALMAEPFEVAISWSACSPDGDGPLEMYFAEADHGASAVIPPITQLSMDGEIDVGLALGQRFINRGATTHPQQKAPCNGAPLTGIKIWRSGHRHRLAICFNRSR